MLAEFTKKEQVLSKAMILTECEADMALVFLAGMQAQKNINNIKKNSTLNLQEQTKLQRSAI